MRIAKNKDISQLLYSCYPEKSRQPDSFVKEHVLIRILSGNMILHSISATYNFTSGDTVLLKRNQLVKMTRIPPANGKYESVSVYFDQVALKSFAAENNIHPQPLYTGSPVVLLTANTLYTSYASSLAAYQQGETNQGLTGLKVKEGLMLMLHFDQAATALLFDFQEPEKTDLEEYMNTHFRFNTGTEHLAYLTGRSLATFKRDFTKIFNTSPGKWLQQRRLKEAYLLIREKRMKASEVYLEVGFEDLSHFSFAFKNKFGQPPSLI